jgi:spore germination protein (amino acid permease)
MDKKITIGNWEVITILINAICTKIFLNFPRRMAEGGGTGGWILTVYVSVLAIIGFYIVQMLYKRFEGKDIIDIGEYIAGRAGRIVVGMVAAIFFMFVICVYLRTFSEIMKMVALTVSPISFVSLFFIVVMIVGAYFGMEAITRIHSVAVPIVVAGLILIVVAVFPYMDFNLAFPVLGTGVSDIFVEGFMNVSVFAEIFFVFMLIPFLKYHKNFKRSGLIALGFSALFLFASAFVYNTVFPYPESIERVLPIYQLARLISYGRFFQRIESIFVIIWAAAALLYVMVGFYLALYSFKKAFKLEYIRPLILPFAVIVFSLSMLPRNLISAVKLETGYARFWAWAVTFGMTILLPLIARFIKKKDKRKIEA